MQLLELDRKPVTAPFEGLKAADRRTDALAAVARQLKGEPALLRHALEAASAIDYVGYRARALAAVAGQLQGEERQRCLRQAVEDATTTPNAQFRAYALEAVAEQLQGEPALLRQALKAAAVIGDEGYRTRALAAVAGQLQGKRPAKYIYRRGHAAGIIAPRRSKPTGGDHDRDTESGG